ncbi:response regulator [Chryseosolibacter indicus]|uniref:Response regulator n=1 Tax=Chryseosolibacter indicus TaxID=2782351 RepID=A0ABS5VRK1_9BACT|nr:response regulator [Chryseosolibacter indicus]MBT1703971.1 response regulator [Chryseosolibacter indicus]
MAKSGPIIIIEDDPDDHEMIERILLKLNVENPIKKFMDGESALQYLQSTSDDPFVIICDINMPIMNGLQLKESIDTDKRLRVKSIPFVFLSTTANPQQVKQAYHYSVQGFFLKGQSYEALKNSLHQIVSYWQHCVHPNNLT